MSTQPQSGPIVAPDNLGIFLAQFMGKGDTIFTVGKRMAEIGYRNVQLPPTFDTEAAAESREWCQNELVGPFAQMGLKISGVSCHIPGQLVCVNGNNAAKYDCFLPREGWEQTRTAEHMSIWGSQEVRRIIDVTAHLGLKATPGFTGSFLFEGFLYPWPPRPDGLVELAFQEMASRWEPLILHAYERGVRLAFELHPGEDVFDGYTFEMFRAALIARGIPEDVVDAALGLNYDPSHLVLQDVEYLGHLRTYSPWVAMYHVKDAQFRPDGRMGAYGGYAPWPERVGKFRTCGRGQVDFRAIEALLPPGLDRTVEHEDYEEETWAGAQTAYTYLTTGVRPPLEGIVLATHSFDDFAAGEKPTEEALRRLLGI